MHINTDMKFNKAKSGMIYPVEKKPDHISHPNGLPKEERMKTFMFRIYRECDKENFEELVAKNDGEIYAWVEVPFRNVWNQKNGIEYYCIYQCVKELEMFICC